MEENCEYYGEEEIFDFDEKSQKLIVVDHAPVCLAIECPYPDRRCKARWRIK